MHYNRLKPFLSPVPEASNLEGTWRRRTVPPRAGASGSAGWVSWRAPGSAGRSEERDAHQPANPGPGSVLAPRRVVVVIERWTGELTRTVHQPADPGLGSAERRSETTSRESVLVPSQVTMEGERQTGEQTSQETRQGRQRKTPKWSRDYEMF